RSKPGMPLAAIVSDGPAETRFTRIPFGPRSRARYRAHDSRPALATPIQSYTGQATEPSNVIPTIDDPCPINGSAAIASAFSEYVETWSAVATSCQEVLRKLPPSASCGANAIECTTPSSPSTEART